MKWTNAIDKKIKNIIEDPPSSATTVSVEPAPVRQEAVPSAMAISIADCEDADMPRIFAIISDSFGSDQPYVDTLFPYHKTPVGRAKGAERLLQAKHCDPHARFLKATDMATGEIIGQAKWLIYPDPTAKKPEELPLSGDYWDSEDEKEYANQLFTGFVAPRRKAIRDATRPLVCTSASSQDHARGAVVSRRD